MRLIRDFYLADGAIVTGDVQLGPGVNIWYGCVIRGDVARITLGPRVNIQDGSIVHADYDMPQIVEEGVVVGHAAVLHGVRVGRDTLVGIGYADRARITVRGTDVQRIDILELQQ